MVPGQGECIGMISNNVVYRIDSSGSGTSDAQTRMILRAR